MTVSVKISTYPNNEVRVVLFRDRPPRDLLRATPEEISEQVEVPIDPLTLDSNSKPTISQGVQPGIAPSAPCGEKAVGWGKLGRQYKFTSRARRMMLRAGGALSRYEPDSTKCLFLTGTLPGSTDESFRAMAEYSSFAVHRIKAWVNKHQAAKMDFYCWEHQQRGALHIHYCVLIEDPIAREYIRLNWKAQWLRILDAIGSETGIDMYRKNKKHTWNNRKEVTKTDAVVVEKSVSAYMSKYVSKNAKNNAKGFAAKYYPVRWYGISRPLLKELKERSTEEIWTFNKRHQAERVYEEYTRTLYSLSVQSYDNNYEEYQAKCMIAYVEEGQEKGVLEEMKRRSPQKTYRRSEQPHCLRQELLKSADEIMRRYPKFEELLKRCLGQFSWDQMQKYRSDLPMTVFEQCDLLNDIEYCCNWWMLAYRGEPNAMVGWRYHYARAKHLLSDGDGAIAQSKVV